MERYRERPRFGLIFWLTGFSAGISLCNLGHILADDSDSRVEKIQTYNEQIFEQLSDDQEGVQNLVLHDWSNSYSFTVSQEGQADQVCEGSYEVNNNVAVAIGDIACTVSTPIGTTTTTIG
ncbi:hypothetical protein KDA00_02010 [Candidatus Saccharibacteria bacterium]|nr:hypothetical protein [Candidatus Saccharibacteria bacterium]